ncbi:hypothetical protein [Mesorhizobium sp.]|uniref:hypothetical protein n=1 Tax=Mesorhizobium sp. TaxID=1871066 RepID=UPI0012226F6F|nr:hypothetical protein [Mesorhizobium sp.]TIL66186.1 MAG: hypothetical protein E5Y77_18835 [Mesorhizobium sp.]
MSAAYIQYNHALNEIFFSGRFAWRPVYLSLDAGMRSELAAMLGQDADDIEESICRLVGHVLNKTGDPYADINAHAKMWWRKSRQSPPPFTALLFTLSHAAALMAAEGDFASNNYYLRLAQVTGRDRQVLSFHGKSTDALWGLLNDWLIENNYELGRPTAAAINSWVYVGKALSQVVVRAGDRELFHDLFARYGFSGNEAISPDEMRHYLANWMLTSRPNRRLKAAWQKPELQQRVCEAAVAELASWGTYAGHSSPGVASTGSRATKMSLAASLVTRFPRPAMLELQLGRSEERGEPLQPLHIDGEDAQKFALANEDFGTFATIVPRPIGGDGRSLSRSYCFETSDSGSQLVWQPRIVIPLAKATEGPYWIEVARVSFGQPHMVLVRDIASFPKKVEGYFADAALAPPAKPTSQQLSGIPSGWVLYTDVRLGQPSSSPPQDLEALVPIGEDGALVVEGNFQLAKGIFHSRSQLTVSLLASSGPTEVFALPLGQPQGEVIKRASDPSGACRLELSGGSALPLSGVRLEGRRGSSVVASTEILLRDAGMPRALDRQGRDALVYRGIISAEAVVMGNPHDARPRAVGMVVDGLARRPIETSITSAAITLPTGEFEEHQDSCVTAPLRSHVARQTCAERGYHYWLCEPLEQGRPKKTPLRQECKDCAQAIIIIDRGKKTARAESADKLPVRSFAVPARIQEPTVDHELLFDALCFLGAGSWGKLESLLADKIEMPWQAREIAQNYFLLGLLDLELRPGTNIVRNWSVPACTASFIDEDTAFLSGFRCQSMLKQIRDAITQAGGSMTNAPRAATPPKVEINELSPVQLSEALAMVRDPLGRPVTINIAPSLSFAHACLAWGDLPSCLVSIGIGRHENLQGFNLITARWEPVASTSRAGAYRWNDGRQTYAFVDSTGKGQCGPHQVVKVLAARTHGRHLHAYDGKTRSLLATLGCDVPGLLGRALVACSGMLPQLAGGMLRYRNVDPETAGTVLATLYKKEEALDEARHANQRY